MKKTILVADDDAGIQDILKIIFEKAGYNVMVIGDARDLLKNNFSCPDLFLIDRLLSGIDGLDICRHLKNNKDTCRIPVVMISASPDIAAQSHNAGADDSIEKPFDLNELLKVIEKNISRSERGSIVNW